MDSEGEIIKLLHLRKYSHELLATYSKNAQTVTDNELRNRIDVRLNGDWPIEIMSCPMFMSAPGSCTSATCFFQKASVFTKRNIS